jgi:hypothetical protein
MKTKFFNLLIKLIAGLQHAFFALEYDDTFQNSKFQKFNIHETQTDAA